MVDTPVHCHRPLWKRPPFWFVIIAAVLELGIGIAMEEAARRAPMPYGAFLDQLEAGNIARVTFRGTQIDGSLNLRSPERDSCDIAGLEWRGTEKHLPQPCPRLR